ncbi:MAG: hypothetical protein IH627_14495 [Rubrivivax sp.]|nr:hypothetical protein [Rubrivivax sp.]
MMGFKRTVAMALVSMASLGAMAADAASASWWDQFKAYTHQQKNDAVKAARKLIADTDKKIDELKRQTRNATAEAKAANEKNMAELQEKKKAAQAELAKLEKASGEIWDATKTGFSNAARELGQAYDKAVESARK